MISVIRLYNIAFYIMIYNVTKQALFGNLHYSLTEVRPSNGSALNINAVIYMSILLNVFLFIITKVFAVR